MLVATFICKQCADVQRVIQAEIFYSVLPIYHITQVKIVPETENRNISLSVGVSPILRNPLLIT